jgi:hypothetical protein
VPLSRRLDGAHDYIWTLRKREKSFYLSGTEPQLCNIHDLVTILFRVFQLKVLLQKIKDSAPLLAVVFCGCEI